MNRVLVVEDHAETRPWLIKLIEETFVGATVVGAANLAQAKQQCAAEPFELALVDIGLPDGSGIDLVRELCERGPFTYCVMVTIHDDDRYLFPALKAGAQGYLLKDQPRERLIAQLKGILP